MQYLAASGQCWRWKVHTLSHGGWLIFSENLTKKTQQHSCPNSLPENKGVASENAGWQMDGHEFTSAFPTLLSRVRFGPSLD